MENESDISLTPSVDKFFGKIKDKCDLSNGKDDITVISGCEAMKEMLYHKYVIAPWNKMIKKSLIDASKIRFNSEFFNGEGFAFSIECFQAAERVAVGQKKVYHYRVGDVNSGASVYKEKYIKSSLNAQQYILSKIKNKSKEMLKAWNFSNWHTHCDAFNIMVGCNAKSLNPNLYSKLADFCQRNASCALIAPISLQQKLRGVLFAINPFFAASVINHFRYRKFLRG